MTDTSKPDLDNHISPPPIPSSPPLSLLGKNEEELYEMAFAEVQGEARRQGLWAKSLSESMGDNQKSQAIYIRLRVEQLIADQAAQRQKEISTPVTFDCPHCGKKLQLTKGQLSEIAKSQHWERSCGVCYKVFDCRAAIPTASFSLPPPPPHISNSRTGSCPNSTSIKNTKPSNNIKLWMPIVIIAIIMSVITVSIRSCQNRQILNSAEQWRIQNQSNWNR